MINVPDPVRSDQTDVSMAHDKLSEDFNAVFCAAGERDDL
jgi:hypothetical protein